MTLEKRKFQRIESSNLAYLSLDEKSHIVSHGKGKTINVSEGGFLIETDTEMEVNHSIIARIELPDDVVELKGKIVHCKSIGHNRYIAGIQLMDESADGKPLWKRFVNRLVKANPAE
jgi:hypothetical protein